MSQLEPPRQIWPELQDYEWVGMHDAVFRVRRQAGQTAYLRADDGSAPLLRSLTENPALPAPRVLDQREGWLLLSALPGLPLHHPDWVAQGERAAPVIAAAWRALDGAGVTHGDMCLPNILGDPVSAQLTGIIDWRYAQRFGREIDVASAVWSCGYNGHPPLTATEALRHYGWPRCDAGEVERLAGVWIALAGDVSAEEATE